MDNVRPSRLLSKGCRQVIELDLSLHSLYLLLNLKAISSIAYAQTHTFQNRLNT